MSPQPPVDGEGPTLLDVAVRDVTCGPGVRIVRPSNVYECDLGAGVFVGPFCEIQRGVRVGARTKVQSHAFICELVEIGEDCFIGHGVMFINDLFQIGGPARGRRELWKRTSIGNHVSLGSNATILPVHIGDHIVVGAGAVVTKDLEKPGIYAGNPARLLRPLEPRTTPQPGH